MFGVLTGHNNKEERIRSAQETAKRNVSGTNHVNLSVFYIYNKSNLFIYRFTNLLGFVLNGNFLGNTSRERIDILKSSLDNLPSNKPRLAYGLGAPGT